MAQPLKGKIAVVTGGTSGIGLAIAKEFVEQGATVALTGLSQSEVDKAASEIGPECRGFEADVSKVDEMEALYQIIQNTCGRLDVVVANAGVGDNAPLGKVTEEQFDKVIGTNLKGVLLTVQSALPLLKSGASVVLIGSTASESAPPSMSLYGATKAGISNFVKTWIKDTSGSGIRFNVLSFPENCTRCRQRRIEDQSSCGAEPAKAYRRTD